MYRNPRKSVEIYMLIAILWIEVINAEKTKMNICPSPPNGFKKCGNPSEVPFRKAESSTHKSKQLELIAEGVLAGFA